MQAAMKNEMVATNSQYDDGFAVAEPVTGGLVQGKMLKFRDDAFLVGGDHLPEDVTQLTVVGMRTLWTRWEDEKPTHRITKSGESHPRRDELPDQDETLWPKGKDGLKSDPWRDGRHVTMIHDASASIFTFVTESVGGRIAVAELKDQIALRRRVRPGACPIVELTTAQMKTRFGDRLRPSFKVVAWHEPEASAAAPKLAPVETTNVKKDEITSAELLDDRIPF
jgi:hypothetical protein